jgi:signal transduction histidine kinase/CHASE3 domain sensor protein
MAFPLERRITLGFVFVLAVVVVIGIVSYLNTRQFIDSNYAVRHSLEVLQELEDVLSVLKDAETGQRGFIITGDESYLEPYNNAVATLDNHIKNVQTLIIDPDQQQQFTAILPIIDERMAVISQSINTRKTEGFDAAQEIVLSGTGKSFMDTIRQQINAMQLAENTRLLERTTAADNGANTTTVVVIVLTFLMAGLLSFIYYLILRDIESRKRAAILMQDARNYAESIVDTVREPLLVIMEDLRVRTASRSFYKDFQVTKEQTENRLFPELGNGQWNIPTLQNLMQGIFKENRDFQDYEVEVEFPSLGRRVMLLNGRRLYREGNHTHMLLLAMEDITERRQSELEIENLNADLAKRAALLETANNELEAFSYSVSHDLRAPLRAVNGFARILSEDYSDQLDDQLKRYLHLIRDNAGHMGRLIDDLLTFSRLSRQPLKKQPVALGEVARQVIRDLSAEAESRQVEWVIGDIPSCRADSALIKQVFVNLLSNALKYSGKRPEARIEVGVQQANGTPTYFVKDNGVGFDMRYANKLFGVFQRLHKAEEYEGTGVGLAIVQRIVQRHGGRVWAEAAVDQGATFYFTLDLNLGAEESHGNGRPD